MRKKYIVALDQGTTSSRAILFDAAQRMVASAQQEFRQFYPRPGWVEHDPEELAASQLGVLYDVIERAGIEPAEIAAIGIANQRETTIVWDARTGIPVCNAIVWQCRRTAPQCDRLKADGHADEIRRITGLPVDAYFSATKLQWILDHVDGARARAERGALRFGTVDSWLIWKLTGGRVHVTDRTNAARTMLYDIRRLCWDARLCALLRIPMTMLPEVKPSSGVLGTATIGGAEIPIAGVAGDQQAALFGQACFDRGDAKNTYGTGCFLLMNTGTQPFESQNGLITTLAASADDVPRYALEGSVFCGGSVIQWLRDELRLIDSSADSEYFAAKVPDTGGVYLVPAFTGLGAPHWDMYARGTMVGLTRGTTRCHLIRAALESIAYQTRDVLDAMTRDTGIALAGLKVDGGASANNLLMQFQSDITNTIVRRPRVRETTALGAAYLAGLAVDFWRDLDELRTHWEMDRAFVPAMTTAERAACLRGWTDAVRRTRSDSECDM